MDEELESTGGTTAGTDVADVPLYAKLLSMKLNLIVEGATSVSTMLRWLLYKKPDGESLVSTLSQTVFHVSDDTPTFREFRRQTMAKGMFVSNPSTATNRLPIFIKRSALARNRSFAENDVLALLIAKAAEGTTCTISGFGTLYFRANG